MRLLDSTVRSILECRLGRWPWQPDYAKRLDRLQRKMVARILIVPQFPGEAVDAYSRRRGRVVAACISEKLTWGMVWAKRVQTWDAHLRRPRNFGSWPAKLILTQDSFWLRTQRFLQSSASIFAGKTGTRAQSGKPAARWEDGVAAAKAVLPLPEDPSDKEC